MTQKNLLIFSVIIFALVGFGAWWMLTQQPQTVTVTQNTHTSTADTFDPKVLGTKSGVDSTIDSEADRIDLEMKASSEQDFAPAGISSQQLGL